MHRRSLRAIAIALTMSVTAFGVAACGSSNDKSSSSSSSSSTAAKPGRQEDQGRPRDRHRRPQRPLVQRPGQQGPGGRQEPARRRRPRAHLEVQRGLRAEPDHARPAEVRPRDRGRLPDGRRDRDRRQEVPERQVRDHRLVGAGPEGRAQERRGPALQGAGGGLPGRVRGRAVRQGQQRQGHLQRRRPEDPAGRPLHRRLPGRAPRRPTRRSRRPTPTRRTSSTRRSARRSR